VPRKASRIAGAVAGSSSSMEPIPEDVRDINSPPPPPGDEGWSRLPLLVDGFCGGWESCAMATRMSRKVPAPRIKAAVFITA